MLTNGNPYEASGRHKMISLLCYIQDTEAELTTVSPLKLCASLLSVSMPAQDS